MGNCAAIGNFAAPYEQMCVFGLGQSGLLVRESRYKRHGGFDLKHFRSVMGKLQFDRRDHDWSISRQKLIICRFMKSPI